MQLVELWSYDIMQFNRVETIVAKNLAFYSAGFMGLTAGLFGGSS